MANKKNKAVFFDRDGTLNVDFHYLHRAEEFVWTPKAREAIKYCNDKGYKVIVVTNQSGVARGYYPESDVMDLYVWMNQQLARIGAHIDGIYYCPHHVDGTIPKYTRKCDCRKPSPRLLLNAEQDFDLDLPASYMVGDRESDMKCAESVGVTGVRYEVGSNLLELVQNNIV